MTMVKYLAHSAHEGCDAQSYQEHVKNVFTTAVQYAKEAAEFAGNNHDGMALVNAVSNTAVYHDLGKLEEKNQLALKDGNMLRLPINHTDAGAAHLLKNNRIYSGIGVMAHHIGLPDFPKEYGRGVLAFRDPDIAESTDQGLSRLEKIHTQQIPQEETIECGATGCPSVFMRLMLSCLADADHGDTARFYGNEKDTSVQCELRPAERLQALNTYVGKLQGEDERSILRTQMYRSCRDCNAEEHIVACDSPVGSGKTTAVMAYLLNQAAKCNLRRIFVVLPFTNIITQSVEKYRECLALPGENPHEVVAEVHHRVDFQTEELRHLSSLWRAPIIVTTAVAFFETMASNRPSVLRRLHELPGSAIFVDEAHAALPSHLLPVAWKWMNSFADEWNCHWILASGSLNRFWMIPQIAKAGTRNVPDLVHDKLRSLLAKYQQDRIEYRWYPDLLTSKQLADWVFSFQGPRLVIVNTVQSAAVIADTMRKVYGRERVEHLSTSLTAVDRTTILKKIRSRLSNPNDNDWALVATSCVQAGVDFSFAIGFREIASLSSLLQASGRVNREGKKKNAPMWSFQLNFACDTMLKQHPIIQHAANVLLKDFFMKKRPVSPDSVTQAIQLELARYGERQMNLLEYDNSLSFAVVQKRFKIIDSNSVPAIVPWGLQKEMCYSHISRQQLQMHTVQIPQYRVKEWMAEQINEGLYKWVLSYDSFLGYMAGVLRKDEVFFV